MGIGLRIGEVIAIVLIAGALSLGFIGGNPSAQVPSIPSVSLLDHYTGLGWSVVSSFSGVADSSPTSFLQSFGSDAISYANLTDSSGDLLTVLQVYFPSSNSALNYLESVAPESPHLVNNVWMATYSLGQVEIVYMVSGSHFVQISYVGSSGSLPSLNSMEGLGLSLIQG
ncbi:hypothetical protein [Metallosphaera hakonensis]|uniref:Uncharacterized protein n=1 Tax=Metallosphaera hakonensis JCM 8857 = DSM 7519 TaxID=1293036 RepID=A0A2U9IT26_9CREN|nr:hypothetical protein [Metallosphaera hakonensis]AWR99112.1 hypothetical protein DFR87_04710 [Metallosphaera hakonensis JCM 8857 = DSM 7519]